MDELFSETDEITDEVSVRTDDVVVVVVVVVVVEVVLDDGGITDDFGGSDDEGLIEEPGVLREFSDVELTFVVEDVDCPDELD